MKEADLSIDHLIDHWRGINPDVIQLIHPADRTGMAGRKTFDLSLIPYPYVGDIRGADVWVLMLNSNIGADDAKQEAVPYFAERLQANLGQELDAYEYRMLSMDPKLRDTGTYAYYNKRNGIAKLITELARRTGETEREARKTLARRLAVVQLFPYRSTTGVPAALLGDALPSVRLARAAVAEAMKSKLVVVPRSAKDWGFEYGRREPNLFTFKADQARSASLQPGGACGGGDAIIERLTT